MADFLLSVGVDVGQSYDQMQKDISSLVSQLNGNPPKIKVAFDIDKSTADSLRNQISEIYKASVGKSGTVNISSGLLDSGNVQKATSDISNMVSAVTKASAVVNTISASLTAVNTEKITDAVRSLDGISSKGASEIAKSLSDAEVRVDSVKTRWKQVGEEQQRVLDLSIKGTNNIGQALNCLISFDKKTGEIKSKTFEIVSSYKEVKQEVKRTGDSISESNKKSSSAVSEAKRAINEYYLILRKVKNESDIVKSSNGFVSISGNYKELAAAMNEVHIAYTATRAAMVSMPEDDRIHLLEQVETAERNLRIAIEERKNAESKRSANSAPDASAQTSTQGMLNDVTVLNAYQTALNRLQKAEENWTAAKNHNSDAVRNSYAVIQEQTENLRALDGITKNLSDDEDRRQQQLNEIKTSTDAANKAFKASETVIRGAGAATKTFSERVGTLAEKFGTWFSITRVIMAAYRAIKQMINESIELERSLAQLKIVTGATDSEMSKFTDTAISMAKSLGQSVSDVVGSIETFSRLGYSLEDASELAKYASILSNVAAVDNTEATTGLTSIIKGFGMDISEAEHVADVLIEVGQKYAVSASEMMEAYERSGAALNATNTSFEKSAGLIAAANAAVQDSSVVGTALKTVSARIRGSKSDLEELGEDTEELADGFSKYADEIKSLTGFNIMVEGSTNEFKDLYDIMEGVSGVWDNLSDTQRARVSEILGGTRQLQVISSIIGNWSDAAGAYSDSMNAAGTATESNDIYMQTAAAHIEQFKASFTELSQQLFSSGFIKFFVDMGTRLLNALTAVSKFIDKVSVLKGLLIAFAVTLAMTSTIKLFVSGITKIISLFKYVIQIIPNAISMWKAYAASNTAAAVAEGEAAAGAVTLSAALQASIPVIGLVLAALTALVGTIAIASAESEEAGDTLQMEQEQTREEMQRTADAAVDETAKIIELYEEYYNAAKAASNLTGSLSDCNNAREKLIEGIGLEKTELQSLIDKYGDYNKALAAAAAQKIGYDLIDIQGGVDAAKGKLGDLGFADVVGGTGYGTGTTANIILGDRTEEQKQEIIDEVNSVLQILQKLPEGMGFIFNRTNVIIDDETNEIADGIYGFFNNTITDEEIAAYGDKATAEVVKKYKALREALRLMSENGIESDNPVYKLMYDSYQYIKEDVESYLGYVEKYNSAIAEQGLYTYLSNNNVPETKAQFDALRQSIIDNIVSNGQYKGTVSDVEDSVDSLLSKQSVFSGFFENVTAGVENATNAVNAFINALSKVNSLSDGLDQLDKIYADVLNGEDFDYGSIIGNADFTKAFSGLGDAYSDFIQIVANSPSDISACQSAFDNLVTSYIKSSGVLDGITDATRNATVAMLEQMGVSNAAAIVDSNLAYQKEVLKWTTGDYANLTYEEIVQLYNECEAGTLAHQVLAELAVQKALVNGNEIRTSSDIDQIISLANAANATTESLQNLAKAKSLLAQADDYTSKAEAANDEPYAAHIASYYNYEAAQLMAQAQELINKPVEYNKIDSSKFKASYSGGSSTNSARESAAKAAEKASKTAEKEETWFEQQYKLHKHLVAMEQETDAEYYSWLNSAMNQAYGEGILELDDYRKYQEEVFSGLRSIFKDYINDIEHEISMRKNYDGESKKIISLYKTLISKVEAELKAAYAQGLTDNDDYVQELLDKWQSYKDGIKDIQDEIKDNAKDAVDDLVDYVNDMQKQEIEDQKDLLDKKLDNLKEFYDKQKEMLEDTRDEEKYEDEQSEKRKSVIDIQSELSMLANDDSAWAQKRKAELNNDLDDAKKELDEFEKDHALDIALDAIEESYNAQEAQIQAEMDALDETLNNPELMFNKALEAIKTNTGNLYQQMLEYNRKYGTGNDEDVKDKYEDAYKALLEYKQLNGKDYNGVTLSNSTGYNQETYANNAPKADPKPVVTTPAAPTAQTNNAPSLSNGSSVTIKKTATNFSSKSRNVHMASFVPGGTYTVYQTSGNEVLIGRNGVYTGWVNKSDIVGYSTGTKHATAGLHTINELGDETTFESKDGTRYKLFSGGEKVLNAKASDFLYEFANGGGEILEKIIKSALGGGLYDKVKSAIVNNNFDMGGITVAGNADKATVSEIRRAQRESLETMLKEFSKLNK